MVLPLAMFLSGDTCYPPTKKARGGCNSDGVQERNGPRVPRVGSCGRIKVTRRVPTLLLETSTAAEPDLKSLSVFNIVKPQKDDPVPPSLRVCEFSASNSRSDRNAVPVRYIQQFRGAITIDCLGPLRTSRRGRSASYPCRCIRRTGVDKDFRGDSHTAK